MELTEHGRPPETTSSAEVVAYRIVQEALTNALKYAHGKRTTVHVHRAEVGTTVEVRTRGSMPAAGSPRGSGRGLAGLRQRVVALGGDFDAGRQANGDFVVRARIPAEDQPRR